jgi:predicted RNase H-like HicB family nuclease
MRDLNYYLGLPYTLEIMPDEDGYFVRVLELPGCHTYADTLEKLWPMLEDAMRDWIEVSLEDGDDIPEPLERSAVDAVRMEHLADTPVRFGHSPPLTIYTY